MSIGVTPESFRGYVGLGKETSYGQSAAPDYFVDAITAGQTLDNQPEFQNTTRSRATHKGEAGPISDEGSIDMPANPENGLGLLLLAAIGTETLTTSDPDNDNTDEVGTHQFDADDTALESLSVEIYRDQDVIRHLGAGIDALELSHTEGEMLTASVDVTAADPDGSVTSTTPAYSDLRNFRFNDVALTIDGNSRGPDVQDFTCSIENNLEPLPRNSRTAGKMTLDERVVTNTVSLDFESRSLFNQFMGSTTAQVPQTSLVTTGFQATWTTPETIESGVNYELIWDTPSCIVNTHEAQIDQDSLVMEDVELRAIYDTGLGTELQVTLQNGITTTY